MFGDWRLDYDGTGYAFGAGHVVEVVEWEQEPDRYITDDELLPRADGVAFGEDFIEPGEITVHVQINYAKTGHSDAEKIRLALAARAELARVWRADLLRQDPGGLAELTIDGTYIVEGRPRRAEFDDAAQNVGIVRAALPFKPAMPGAYIAGPDAGWQSFSLGLVPAQGGGLRAPLRAPLRTSVESSRSSPVQVAGDIAAWGIYELQGPIQADAQIESVRRWRLYLNRPLGAYQTATIDTRPGRRATYLNGKPVQLLDPRSSMLSECSLLPGPNVIALRGVSIEGTAEVSGRWRNQKGAI